MHLVVIRIVVQAIRLFWFLCRICSVCDISRRKRSNRFGCFVQLNDVYSQLHYMMWYHVDPHGEVENYKRKVGSSSMQSFAHLWNKRQQHHQMKTPYIHTCIRQTCNDLVTRTTVTNGASDLLKDFIETLNSVVIV